MTDPNFLSRVINPFGLEDLGGRAAPTFADIDDDGDLDAFVGNAAGDTVFFENNPLPDAVDDTITTDEDNALSGSVFADNGNGADSDPQGEPITVTAVNGNAAGVGNQINLASGALLTLNSDGTFDYDPNGAFENLNNGDTGNDSFTYTIEDASGSTDTATVTVTITGVEENQAPTGDITDQTVDAYSIFKLEASDFITDADGDALTYSANLVGGDPLPSWLNIDPATGKLSGLPTASDEGILTIEVTADDGNGGVFTDSFDLAIELPLNSTTNTINGNSGDNNLPGTNANDNINGRAGNDDINGKQGDDNLYGNAGNDDINGMAGNDYIDGGNGNDLLNGENDNDILVGGFGDDTPRGGNGNDTVDGGNGADQFVLTVGEGRDTIRDYVDGKDSFLLTGGLSFGSLNITDSGTGDTIISAEGSGVLAILEGVNSSLIEASDFTTIHQFES